MSLVVVRKYDWGVEKDIHFLQTWEGVFLESFKSYKEDLRTQGIPGLLSSQLLLTSDYKWFHYYKWNPGCGKN